MPSSDTASGIHLHGPVYFGDFMSEPIGEFLMGHPYAFWDTAKHRNKVCIPGSRHNNRGARRSEV